MSKLGVISETKLDGLLNELDLTKESVQKQMQEFSVEKSRLKTRIESLLNELVSVKDHNTRIRHDLETKFDGLLDELDSTKEHDAKSRCNLETK